MKPSTLLVLGAMSLLACGKGAPPNAPDAASGAPSFAESLGEWTSEKGIRLQLADRAADKGPLRADYHDGTNDDPSGAWSMDDKTHHLEVNLSQDRRVCGRWTDGTTLRITKVLPAANHHCPSDASVYEYALTKQPAARP